jgi:hypothetical protein
VAKLPESRFETAESLVEAIDNAHLAAPEIPIPIRLFSQEAGTLALVLAFLAIIAFLAVDSLSKRVSYQLAILPAVVLGAIGFTRALQASSMVRRLALTGFQPADVLKGMRAVVDEREGMRVLLRRDQDTLRRRRITLISALFMLPLSIGLMRLSGVISVSVGTGASVSTVERPRPDFIQAPAARSALAATGLSLFGVSLILLARSPFRMPLGERLFRLTWLGAPGRLFVRASMRGVATQSSRVSARATPSPAGTEGNRPPAPAAPPAPSADKLASLEARIAELERRTTGT